MREVLNELALFAGIGGGILGGSLLGWRTVCAVEKESYCREVLLRRQRDGLLPLFPIWDDVKTFDGRPWRGKVDVISGGFPCQDISCAGKGEGITGKRSGLWGEMARIISEVRPQYVFVENSPLLVSRGLTTVLSDLAEMGYDAKWCIVSAADCGAPHRRDRVWIYGNSNSEGQPAESDDDETPRVQGLASDANSVFKKQPQRKPRGKIKVEPAIDGQTGEMADSYEVRRTRGPGPVKKANRGRQSTDCGRWPIEPDVGRVVNGVSNRLHRLEALGNAQVPRVAATAWRILTGQ